MSTPRFISLSYCIRRSERQKILRVVRTLIYLRAPRALLRDRLAARSGHFAGVALLESQLALLEEPAHGLVLDASRMPEQLVQTIRSTLHR